MTRGAVGGPVGFNVGGLLHLSGFCRGACAGSESVVVWLPALLVVDVLFFATGLAAKQIFALVLRSKVSFRLSVYLGFI